ncbi:MAG: glutamate racemase [Brumimicrobium sp.]|nr:glutamate racemase [Brumimicrobium sp.]
MLKHGLIGFFDSGYGGLTVLKEVQALLPQYDYLYLGDNKRAPYGEKTQQEVYEYTWESIQYLFSQGCELVILACNTASAKALRRIQQNDLLAFPDKRVLGVIRPSAEIVGTYSQTNQLVVLGTRGTILSNTYLDEFNNHSPQTIVHQYACPSWVPIIESGKHASKEGLNLIKEDLDAIIKLYPQADVILLGCTHYPIIQDFIQTYLPSKIKVVSQGEIVAASLKDYLNRHDWLQKKLTQHASSKYLTTGNPADFEKQAKDILRLNIKVEQIKL